MSNITFTKFGHYDLRPAKPRLVVAKLCEKMFDPKGQKKGQQKCKFENCNFIYWSLTMAQHVLEF